MRCSHKKKYISLYTHCEKEPKSFKHSLTLSSNLNKFSSFSDFRELGERAECL